DFRDLPSLIESFKTKARLIASEGRITMFKERGPADLAEELSASTGLVLLVPSTEAGLPGADPYPDGRIITVDIEREFQGREDGEGPSRLDAYLKACRSERIASALWCPIVYYKYCVGVVSLLVVAGEERALSFPAVDLAWEFSRVLAWFLKKYDYFSRESAEAMKGRVVDASPHGFLVAVDESGPPFDLCAPVDLRLRYENKSIVCRARIARGFVQGAERFYGVELLGITSMEITDFSRILYGESGDSRIIEGQS
ncbi:MAG: PilZ domain-containing protein, partial [Spirochaetaceae bacterium]|nr:PilZ domain-containing protein [Spirochaetaceae bacterium]